MSSRTSISPFFFDIFLPISLVSIPAMNFKMSLVSLLISASYIFLSIHLFSLLVLVPTIMPIDVLMGGSPFYLSSLFDHRILMLVLVVLVLPLNSLVSMNFLTWFVWLVWYIHSYIFLCLLMADWPVCSFWIRASSLAMMYFNSFIYGWSFLCQFSFSEDTDLITTTCTFNPI